MVLYIEAPDSGIVIKPSSEMNTPKNLLAQRQAMKNQVKKLGYVEQYNENAVKLLNFTTISANKFNAISGSYNNQSDYKKVLMT
jgi:hypothetical protein